MTAHYLGSGRWNICRPFDEINAEEKFVIFDETGKEIAKGYCTEENLNKIRLVLDKLP